MIGPDIANWNSAMRNSLILKVVTIVTMLSSIIAYAPSSRKIVRRSASFSIASTVDNSDESSNSSPRPNPNKNMRSEALPFLKYPPVLAENLDVPGNVGFDPFGFVQDKDDLIAYQEAEIKHARLAMLVRL
jgi:Chlorophyll A-B binding protein